VGPYGSKTTIVVSTSQTASISCFDEQTQHQQISTYWPAMLWYLAPMTPIDVMLIHNYTFSQYDNHGHPRHKNRLMCGTIRGLSAINTGLHEWVLSRRALPASLCPPHNLGNLLDVLSWVPGISHNDPLIDIPLIFFLHPSTRDWFKAIRITAVVDTCRSSPLAQWIARWTSNPKVAGSSPAGGARAKRPIVFSYPFPSLSRQTWHMIVLSHYFHRAY
jgi:hypothetical protein